jgi:hypothetical protein
MCASQGCRDTVHSFHLQPIMLAVQASRLHVVDFMLSIDNPATAASLCFRDVQGSLPLHIAVKKSLVHITTSLLKISESRLLYTEDGVGITPLEIASLQHLLRLTSIKGKAGGVMTWRTPPRLTSLDGDNITKYIERVERPDLEAAETLSALVQSLNAEGRFTTRKDLKDILTEYAERTMKIARQPNKEEEGTIEPETGLGSRTESPDVVGTFKLIKSAVGHSTRRELVHLLDAQSAVGNALDQAINQCQNDRVNRAKDEFGEEAAEKTDVKWGLMQIWNIGKHFYDKEKA